MDVLLIIEDRSVPVEVSDGKLDTLKQVFSKICEEDQALRRRVLKYMPTFSSHHTKFKRLVELTRNSVLTDGQEVHVSWTPLEKEESMMTDTSADAENSNIQTIKELDIPSTSKNSKQDTGINNFLRALDLLPTDKHPENFRDESSDKIDDGIKLTMQYNNRDPGVRNTVLTGEGQVEVLSIQEDSQCLFSAVAHQLHPEEDIFSEGHVKLIEKYRLACVKHLQANSTRYSEQLMDSIGLSPHEYKQRGKQKKIQAYLRNLKSGKEWGAAESLSALSESLNINIKVYQEVQPRNDNLRDAESQHFNVENPDKHINIVLRVSRDPEELQKKNPKRRNHYDSFMVTLPHQDTAAAANDEALIVSPSDHEEDEDHIGNKFQDTRRHNEDNNTNDDDGSSSTSESFGEVEEYFLPHQWTSMNTYEKKRQKRLFEKHEAMQKLGFIKTPFQPEVIMENTGENKIPTKKKVTRTKKTAVHTLERIAEPDDLLVASLSSHPANDSPNSLSNTDDPETCEKKRRKAVRKRRLIGQSLIGSKALPTFSTMAITSLNSSKPDMNLILKEIRSHVEAVTGELKPTIKEYAEMGSKLVAANPSLADADDPKGYRSIVHSMSASFRGIRNYYLNKKPRQEEVRKKKLAEGKHANVVRAVCHVDAGQDSPEKLNTDLVSMTDLNNEKIKYLISKTTDIREAEFEKAQSLTDLQERVDANKAVWKKYPHYKDSRLLIYEHCRRQLLKSIDIQSSYEAHMETLGRHFNMSISSERDKIVLLLKVGEDLTPTQYTDPQKGIIPVLELKDVAEAEGHRSIRTGHWVQAPCVLVLSECNDNGEIILARSYLRMYDGVVSTCDAPTALEVVLQLLSPYFVSSTAYPDAYKSFLRYLEKMVHGGLSLKTQKQRPHKLYDKFIKKLEETQK